jgi:oligogalacturonide lyase
MKTAALTALTLILAYAPMAHAQSAPPVMVSGIQPGATAPAEPPREWIDQTTGHRVVRISDEPGSTSNYFNVNSFTPDGQWMAFTSPSGIMALNLKTQDKKLIVPGRVSLLFVGRRTGTVYYTTALETTQGADTAQKKPMAAKTVPDRDRRGPRDLMGYDINSGQSRKIVTLQPGYSIETVNADETLFAGARITGGPTAGTAAQSMMGTRDPGDEVGPDGKKLTYAEGREVQINRRLMQKIPMEIFTVDAKTGAIVTVTASTDWLNHLQFSPTDPDLLLYCHEGNWHIVDRLWLVNVKTHSKPMLLHKRTMNMEIAGHEWWSADGRTVWYDLQTPRGVDFWVAGYRVADGHRTWYHMEQNDWGVHFNQSPDGSVFSSDGGDSEMAAHAPDGKYLYLLHPNKVPDVAGIHAANSADLIEPGFFTADKLVDMRLHNYRLEPNATFTPDGKWLVFRSNMWGPAHVYAVELAKAER